MNRIPTPTTSAVRLAISMVAAAGFAWVSPALAGDIAQGKAKADQVCASCHGKDGNTTIDPSYPKLAGQYRDYLERALLDYKSGQRKNAIMAGFAQGLSRDDIRNLAAYYASLPGQLSARR
jgi:cytochrome c553